jgi:N-acetylmuramoyl-L-alanine amidase
MESITHGAAGPEVEDVQRRLAELGAPCGEDEPGRFGDGTRFAVRTFQQARGLPADGVVDEDTWQVLVNASYRLGDRLLFLTRPLLRGDDVRDLQQRLNRLGFDAGYDDGLYGPLTVRALSGLQADVGLPVDGILGPATLDAIRRLHRDHQAAPVFVARERAELRRPARPTVAGARVMLDPSHGPADPGLVGPDGLPEHEITWRIASLVEGRLAALGARVVLSRGPSTTPTQVERAMLANHEGVELILSVHANGSDSGAARGVAAYYFGSADGPVSARGRRLADLAADLLVGATGSAHCRTHPSTMTILSHSRAPAVVVEPGFLTHPEEGALLTRSEHQRAIADALTEAVVTFLTAPAR